MKYLFAHHSNHSNNWFSLLYSEVISVAVVADALC